MFAALEKLLADPPPRLAFCSADVDNVFASGYCLDAYFLYDPNGKGHEKGVMERFTGRAVTKTWPFSRLPAKEEAPFSLPGLACRYFRFLPDQQSRQLTVTIRPRNGRLISTIKAELAFAAPHDGYYVPSSKVSATKAGSGCTESHVCQLQNFSRQTCDHAVLMVTNCAIGLGQTGNPVASGYTQRAEFTIQAEFQ